MGQATPRFTDTFNNAAKDACRRRNLAVVRTHAPGLWDDQGRLRCNWGELLGSTGRLSLRMLLEENALRANGFVGIDWNPKHVESYQAEWPDMQWVCGDLYTSITQLLTASIGVLNLDGYGEAGTSKANANLASVRPLVSRAIRDYGEFVLFWNKCIDSTRFRGRGQPSKALSKLADDVVATLAGYAPRSSLDREKILPVGAAALIDDGFEGEIGAFDIYRGTDRGWRMANLRLVL